MQPIDPNTLFSIFEQGDESIYKEHGIEDTLNNPYVLMGMVIRGVENYHMMDIMYQKQYPREYKNVRNITKYKYYTKLVNYLTRIDSLKFSEAYKIGESFESGEAFVGLDVLRKYFEGIEQYEKCAIIKRYQDLLTKKPVKKVGHLI